MQFNSTINFGADAWDRLFPGKGKPRELKTYEEIKGSKLTAVSTPGDILFHIRAKKMGLCYEFAAIIDEKLKERHRVFQYIDNQHKTLCYSVVKSLSHHHICPILHR